ncbi:MAG: ATP-binding domain-containing protein, partial [Acidimicrobiales bacterium]
DQLRDGHPLRALAAFMGAGRLVTAPSMGEAREALVARWREATERGEDALMLAVNRRDVDMLNISARRVFKDAGVLGEDRATFGDLALGVGDVVVATRNDPGLGVVNGTRGVVEELDRTHVVVSTPEGHRALPAAYAAEHLSYGYALTVHKAQGVTVDRAFVLATESLTREAGYVAMSRAREGTELFVPAIGIDEDADCRSEVSPSDDPLERVGARLSVSKAKQLALDEYQPVLFDAPPREVAAPDVAAHPSTRPPRRRATDNEPHAGGLLRDPGSVPDYLVAAIGRPPALADERAEYQRVARALANYRDRYEVVGIEPLGPVPTEALQRTRYEDVRRALRAYERRLGRERELPGLDLGGR